jgi:hypothetical protein
VRKRREEGIKSVREKIMQYTRLRKITKTTVDKEKAFDEIPGLS